MQKNAITIVLSEGNVSNGDSEFKGTFAYSPPEIIKNEDYTQKGDVYSYGMIVYEILTNEIVFKGMNRYQVILEILKGYHPEFKYPIPYCYRKFIEKCLSPNPDNRPSFFTIVANLEQNPNFLTENIDKEEFNNYVLYVKQSKYFDPQTTMTNKESAKISNDLNHV